MQAIRSAAGVANSAPLPSALRSRGAHLSVRGTLRLLTVFLVACAWSTARAELPYRVELEAPENLKRVVEPILDLPRWKDYPGMTPDLLRRLAVEERDHIRAAVETEGYFSAKVSTEVTEGEPAWRVRILVDPGERTRIAKVEIRFSGPLLNDPDAGKRMSAVRRAWGLPVGAPFRQADWDAAKAEAVRGVAARHGWDLPGSPTVPAVTSRTPSSVQAPR